jgi:hypothetical protein
MILRSRQALVALAIAAVVASVVGGLLLLGSPQEARERILDARRIAEIRTIANAVDLYWTRQGHLPVSLVALSQGQGIQIHRFDPETKRPYDYRVLGDNSYELCAEFARDAAQDGLIPQGDFWAHGSGSQCFRLEPKTVKR